MDGSTIAYLIIGMMGVGATITGTVMASMRTLSHFDAKRDDARAQAEIKRTEERAKEREHELRLVQAQSETTHQDEVKKLQAQISEQAMKIAAIEEMVNTRLFEVIDEEHGSRRALAEEMRAHTKTIGQAQHEMAANIDGLPVLLRLEIERVLDQLQVVQRALQEKIETLYDAIRPHGSQETPPAKPES